MRRQRRAVGRGSRMEAGAAPPLSHKWADTALFMHSINPLHGCCRYRAQLLALVHATPPRPAASWTGGGRACPKPRSGATSCRYVKVASLSQLLVLLPAAPAARRCQVPAALRRCGPIRLLLTAMPAALVTAAGGWAAVPAPQPRAAPRHEAGGALLALFQTRLTRARLVERAFWHAAQTAWGGAHVHSPAVGRGSGDRTCTWHLSITPPSHAYALHPCCPLAAAECADRGAWPTEDCRPGHLASAGPRVHARTGEQQIIRMYKSCVF